MTADVIEAWEQLTPLSAGRGLELWLELVAADHPSPGTTGHTWRAWTTSPRCSGERLQRYVDLWGSASAKKLSAGTYHAEDLVATGSAGSAWSPVTPLQPAALILGTLRDQASDRGSPPE